MKEQVLDRTMNKLKGLLVVLGQQIDRAGYMLIERMGGPKAAMAGVFVVNYIIYELVKYF
jgi:hypothetical protein